MSRLESAAQGLIGSLIMDGNPVSLDPTDQDVLSAWVAEMFMAYAITFGPLDNPFSISQYRQLAATSTSPPEIEIWVARVNSMFAQVGLVLQPWRIGPRFDPEVDQYNAAVGFVAAGGLVFLMLIVPGGVREIAGALHPPGLEQGAPIARIGPSERTIYLGDLGFGEEYMELVMDWADLPRLTVLPGPVGLRPEEQEMLHREFLGGMPLEAIRRMTPETPHSDEFWSAADKHEQVVLASARRMVEAGDPAGAGRLLARSCKTHFSGCDFEGAARLQIAAIETPGAYQDQDAEAAYRVGQCYWNMRDRRAADWYQQAIALGLDRPEPKFGIVDSWTWEGRYAEALRLLDEIQPDGDRQRAIQLVARSALAFLVDDLKLKYQERGTVELERFIKDPADSDDVLAAIRNVDAISRPLWRMSDALDVRVRYHFARAWFGDHATSWMAMVAAVAEQDLDMVEPVFRLGLDRIPELFENAERIFDALESSMLERDPVIGICREVVAGLRVADGP